MQIHACRQPFLLQCRPVSQTARMQAELMLAVWTGNAVAARKHLADGAKIDWKASRAARSPLAHAAKFGHAGIASILLDNGAEVDELDAQHYTALHEAARAGHSFIADLLLTAGADVDRVTGSAGSYSALRLAVLFGHPEMVYLLCSWGAQRYGGEMILATVKGHHAIAGWLAAKADCITPLHYPTLVPPERARRLLRARGADLRAARDPGGRTPLSLARELEASGNAPAGSTAWLVLRAAQLGSEVVTGAWSRHNHVFWPAASRRNVVGALLAGALLAQRLPRLADPWDCVLRHAAEE